MGQMHTQDLAVNAKHTLPTGLCAPAPQLSANYHPARITAAGLAGVMLLAQLVGLISLGLFGWLIAPLLGALCGFITVGITIQTVSDLRHQLAIRSWHGYIHQQLDGAWCRYRVTTASREDEVVVQVIEYAPLHQDNVSVDEMMFTERIVRHQAFTLEQEAEALELMVEWSQEANNLECEAACIAARRDEASRMAGRINQQIRNNQLLSSGSDMSKSA